MKNTSKGERFVKIVNLPEKKRGEYGKNPTNQFLMSNVELGIRSIQVSHFFKEFSPKQDVLKEEKFFKGNHLLRMKVYFNFDFSSVGLLPKI